MSINLDLNLNSTWQLKLPGFVIFLSLKDLFGVPHLATFIPFFIEYVIASIAYIPPAFGGIQTHDLLDVSLLS